MEPKLAPRSASSPRSSTAAPVSPFGGAVNGFAQDSGADALVSLDFNTPGTLTTVGSPNGEPFWGAGFLNGDTTTLYMLGDSGLFSVDTATGAATEISGSAGGGDVWGMTADPTSQTLYWVGPTSDQELSTVDSTTGATTLLGAITGVAAGKTINAIAADAQGRLFGTVQEDDTLISIDKTNGATATIGSLGFDVTNLAGLAFDSASGKLYLTNQGDGQVYTVDIASGTATAVGAIQDGTRLVAIAIGGAPGVTFTVTPSVGTASGTISPDTPQTVNSGASASFTLTPASGFHLDNVGGTCGGTLTGNVYATAAVTADCTVIANFAAGEPVPVISATPSPLAIAVDAGATQTGTLTVANTGGGTLTYSISEAAAKAAANPKASRTKHARPSSVQLGQSTFARAQPYRDINGKLPAQPVVLGGLTISQMEDNTIGNDGVGCGNNGEDDPAAESTADNSWWRRFYFSEHPEVGATANVASVTIGAGQNGIGVTITDMPVTINLYTIPHSTPVDTLVRSALTLIGTGTGTIDSGNVTATIPVTGAIDDTVGKDLVVEFHVDGNEAGEGFLLPGANTTPQTHPSFLSSETCGVSDPTSTDELGFEDFHLVMIVTLGEGGGATCDNPSDVSWLSVAPASGSLAGGASADSTVTVDASTLTAGSYSANLCVTSNDPATPLVTVPVNVTVAPVAVEPCSADDTIFCDGFDGAGGGPFEQPVQDPSLEATDGDAGENPNWTGVDDNSDGGTPFWPSASTTLVDGAHTGDFVAWGGGWGEASSQHWLQSVTIAGGGPRFLNFWRRIDQLPSGGTATLKVSVDGTEVSTLDVLANGADADWVNVSVDVSSYADGAAHEIRFDYAATGSDDGDVYVDDMTIDETEGSKRPNPSHRPITSGSNAGKTKHR